jgi:radical SAM protein with 4Fe4S-binding SPASM domain
MPKIAIRLMPNGDIFNCLNAFAPVANVRDVAIEKILNSEKLQRLQKNAEKCFRCNDPPVIECSYLWQFNPRTTIDTFRLFMEN